MTDAATSEPGPETGFPRPLYAWGAVALLTLAYALSLLDRWVLTLLVAPIKAALDISDTAVGLLMGPIFAAVYVLSGLPFGWAVDRLNRRNLVTGAIGFWSVMTVASGFTRSFFQLAVCRFGIGFGEAALSPAATSLIADMFPRRKINAAVGVFNLGIYTGMGLSYLIGGALLAWATLHHATFLGGSMAPWQIVFVLVGVPGFLVALALMAVIREPARRGAASAQGASMKACFAHIGRHRSALVPLAVGMGTVALFGYAFTWLPTLFTRVWGWPPQQFSMYYGVILLTLGPLGTVTGGVIANRLYDRGHKDAPFRVLSVSLPMLVLVGGTAALWPNPYLAIAALAVSAFFSSMSTSTGVASVVFATPSAYRGRVLALYTMVNSMIGTLIGPTGVGLLNDTVFGDGAGIRWSLASILLVVGGVLTAYLLTGRKGYARAVTELEAAA
ncbi:MFS transporter [Novosphingobium resinovorum]|uniref:MFS transporter n=1 Tax=Novosphingobium resinovorum TaxID=158500 RepID=UPI002ED3A6C3|nr:MFS transporter [Novosphingobium resinovorum]